VERKSEQGVPRRVDLPSLEEVLSLTTSLFREVEEHTLAGSWMVGVHEGILLIFSQRLELFYRARVPLDPTTRRASISTVLSALFVIIMGEYPVFACAPMWPTMIWR
jgi:hypothetical protein